MVATPAWSVCNAGFDLIMQSAVYPVLGIASLLMGVIIAGVYMYGEAIHNPKAAVWAKTEIAQLFISIVFTILLISFMGALCSFKVADVVSITNLSSTNIDKNMNFFEGAHTYLYSAANYSHNVLKIERHILGGVNMGENRARWCCGPDCSGANELWCLFGSSGMSVSAYSGASIMNAAIGAAFNSALISYMSAMNFLFIFLYGISGMMLFLFPMGVVVRSIPFMRGLGSLMLAVGACFFIVYPLLLNVLFLISDSTDMFTYTVNGKNRIEGYIDADDGLSSWEFFQAMWAYGSYDQFEDLIFDDPSGYKFVNDALAVAGRAFVIGVFFPTIALLGTIASIKYVGRLLGEEIDLSRVVQLI